MKNKQKMSSPFKSLLSGRLAVIAIPYVWLLLFFLLPFIFVLKISLAEPI
ncbi:MAG: ABC transporter permease, partial [Candidatus Thioglobus sp.]|nr:ABC transporter permease [Candidatus Thioglobus sp.]